MLASNVETTISNKRKEMVWGSERPERGFKKSKISSIKEIQSSEDKRSDLIETDKELEIQFSSVL